MNFNKKVVKAVKNDVERERDSRPVILVPSETPAHYPSSKNIDSGSINS